MKKFVISVFGFIYLNALSCSSVNDVKKYGGHYYTITAKKMTFLNAKTFAEANDGYLAIPNSSGENNFLKSLIPTPKYAWIGVYDPDYMTNYCYGEDSCSYDDSRFVDIKGNGLSYTNWAEYQPDNLVKIYDITDDGRKMVSPLGEHWVAISSIDGKWADFGNHADEYNNPIKYYALIEFNEMPECYTPPSDVNDTYSGAKCNTKIWDKRIGDLSSGETYTCLKDRYDTTYCPAALAECGEEWDYKDGYAVEHTGVVRDYTSVLCPNGGEYYEGKCRKATTVSYTSYERTVEAYQEVVQISRHGSGSVNVADCNIYKVTSQSKQYVGSGSYIAALFGGSSDSDFSTTLWDGNETIPSSWKTYWSWSCDDGNWVKLKCVDNTIYYNTRNDDDCRHTNYYTITVDGENEVWQCPDGYEEVDRGTSWDCYKLGCPDGYSNPDGSYCYALPTCPDGYSIDGDKCFKDISYSYYEYKCTSEVSSYDEDYEPIDSGLTTCTKTDPDTSSISETTLDDSCDASTPPPDNCKRRKFVCTPAPDRKCVYVDSKWQCSPFPCFGEGAGDYNVTNADTPVGANDKKNDGWNSDGKCSGTIYIFNGKDKRCRSSDTFFGLTGGGCCDKDKVFLGLVSCKEDEKKLAKKRDERQCHYIGEYCSKELDLVVSSVCIQHKKTYCCFNSKLARIINEQGRPQIGKSWGSAKEPDCSGFKPEEFQKLDFSKLDLSEFYEDISHTVSADVVSRMTDYIEHSVTTSLEDMTGD